MSNSSSSSETNLVNRASRRDFLRASALGLSLPIATGALAACSTGEAETAAGQANAAAHAGGAHAAPAAAAAVKTPESIRAKADEMDAMHEKGIKSFPAPTEGKGNQPLAPRLENGVKVFDLETSIVQWEVEPGRRVEAWAYNGQVPGPQIRVREGDRVRINLRNGLEESTAIHFHGLEVPFDQDGVPFITQPPVKPGESYTYEFVVPNAGSHMYHSHHNSAKQVGLGLLGAFIVEPREPRAIEKVDVDYTMILNDGYHGFTLNGKGFPATEPIVAKRGQKVRIRYMNEGMMIHPMHLHGMHMTVIDKDGWPQPQPWKCDTINIAPGERWDVIVEANNPGTWAFHCHILSHAETEHGMFGMVTVMVVE
jgi:FtsP/CotA-like multicopper oxidase with cupredoxin domain